MTTELAAILTDFTAAVDDMINDDTKPELNISFGDALPITCTIGSDPDGAIYFTTPYGIDIVAHAATAAERHRYCKIFLFQCAALYYANIIYDTCVSSEIANSFYVGDIAAFVLWGNNNLWHVALTTAHAHSNFDLDFNKPNFFVKLRRHITKLLFKENCHE